MEGVGGRFAKWLTIDKQEMALWSWCLIYIVFLSLVSFFSFYLVWYFWLKRNTILNTYMQFLCECMNIDCEIDCDARGRWPRSCPGHQITQGRHCEHPWSVKSKCTKCKYGVMYVVRCNKPRENRLSWLQQAQLTERQRLLGVDLYAFWEALPK